MNVTLLYNTEQNNNAMQNQRNKNSPISLSQSMLNKKFDTGPELD